MFGAGIRFEIGQTLQRHEKSSILIKWWFASVIILLPLYGFAQLRQEGRFETTISFENDFFDVAPARENGLILYRRIGSYSGDHLEIIHTDTALTEQWRGTLPIDYHLILCKQIALKEHLYFVFYDEDFSDRNFHLYKIDIKTGGYYKFIIRNSIPFVPTVLEATSVGILLGGYFNRVPLVLFFEFSTQKSKILPGLFNETGELDQIKVNADNTFDLLIGSKNYQKQQTLWIKNYDPTGKLIRNVMLKPEGNNHLIFGRTIQTKNNTQIIAGVYGNRNGEYSRGLFIAQVNDEGVQQIEYYNFADLENFFKYMRAKQEKRVKERIERKKIKGKRIRFQYQFIVHELVPYKNQFILLGEAFFKRYKSSSNTGSPLLASSYDAPRIFDGYQYTHAAVLGIGPQGNLLWDNSFEINDVRTFSLEQFVKIDAQRDKIALLYLFDNKIRTKIIQDSTVLEGKTSSQLEVKSSDILASEDQTGVNKLDYWYGDHFLAYGVQSVMSPSSKIRKRKKVFFINKISYQ